MPKEDKTTGVLIAMPPMNSAIHNGNAFYVDYSVADIGAMTSPNDMITISFTTPSGLKWLHMRWEAVCSAGARVRLIEGKTGGGENPTGTLQTYNHNRSKENVSKILDVAGANASKVSYDATLFTGGETLSDVYIGAGNIRRNVGGDTGADMILKADTLYQLSVYETSAVPALLGLTWVESISFRTS